MQHTGKRRCVGPALQCLAPAQFEDLPSVDPPKEPEVITSFTYEMEMADDDENDIAGHRALAGRTMNLVCYFVVYYLTRDA